MRWLWLALVLFSLPAQAGSLRIAMVTSLEASGLASKLIDRLQEDTGLDPRIIITGSGRALFLLERGDVDLVLTHDPVGEQKLIAAGHASQRIPIMQNRFVLVGPQDDPAQIDGQSVTAALTRLYQSQSLFISRGDLSGTHRKELQLWNDAGLTPGGRWYRSVGSGMAASIRMIAQLEGYGLVDEASYAQLAAPAGLRAFRFAHEPRLINVYSLLMPVRPKPDAIKLAQWLQGEGAQTIISGFRVSSRPAYWPAGAAAGSPAQP